MGPPLVTRQVSNLLVVHCIVCTGKPDPSNLYQDEGW